MNSNMSSPFLPAVKTSGGGGGGGGGHPSVVVSSPSTTALFPHVSSSNFSQGDRGGGGGGAGGERGSGGRVSPMTAPAGAGGGGGGVVVSSQSPAVLKHVGNKGIREAALRMMKSVRSGKVQLDGHDARKGGRKTSFSDQQDGQDKAEEVALVSGVRLSSVIAFEKFFENTPQLFTSRGFKHVKGKEDSSQLHSTLAMAVFNLPHEAQRRAADASRWRSIFAAMRSPRPSEARTLVFLASMAEAARRYDEADVYVVQLLLSMASRNHELTQDERACIQRTFHRRLQQNRNTWKQALALEKALELSSSHHSHHHHHALSPASPSSANSSSGSSKKASQLAELTRYKGTLKVEIIRHCYAVIWSVTHLILPHTSSAVNRVFSYKTIAAAFRQATQFTDSIPQYQCLELAELNYKRALELADETEVRSCYMLRLETLISWCNFLYYNLEKRKEALESARKTLQEGIDSLQSVPEDQYTQVAEALDTLMKNIWRWSQETSKDAVFDWWGSSS